MLTDARRLLDAVRRRRIAVDSAWSFVGVGGRALTSLATFLLLTRSLGATRFGVYAGVAALVSILIPVMSAGAGHLLIQRVAREPATFRASWGDAIFAAGAGLTLMCATAYVAGLLILPEVSPAFIVVYAAGELLATALVEMSAQAYTALRRFAAAAWVHVLYGLARLGALAAVLVVLPDPTLLDIALAYLGVSAVAGAVALVVLGRRHGAPQFDLASGTRSLWYGSKFVASQWTERVHNDVDKTMLLRANLPAAAGIYGAAYRLVSYSFLPGTALINASYPRFFQRGRDGVGATSAYARTLMRPLGLYAVAVGVLLLVFAPLVDDVLGPEYTDAVAAMRLLAFVPLVQGAKTVFGDALTGADAHGFRTGCIVVAALVNVVLNAVLIPVWSWAGAVTATYVSEGLLLVLLLIGIARTRRRGGPT